MCPSLAESDTSGFPRSEVSNPEPQANKKFFDALESLAPRGIMGYITVNNFYRSVDCRELRK